MVKDKIDKLIWKYKDEISDLEKDLRDKRLLRPNEIYLKKIRIEYLEDVIFDLYKLE